MKRLRMAAVSALLLFVLAGCDLDSAFLDGTTYSATAGGETITAVFSGGNLKISGPGKSDERPYTYDEYFKSVDPALGGNTLGWILEDGRIFAFKGIWAKWYFSSDVYDSSADKREHNNHEVLYLHLE